MFVHVKSQSCKIKRASSCSLILGGDSYAKRLEVLGMVCPFPLIEAQQAIEELNSGDELVVDFDCTQGTESIPRWAAEAGHTVTNFEQTDEAAWTITIQKK